MLTLQVLNSDATLNHFETFGSYSFVSGSDCHIVLRLQTVESKLRYIPDAGATFSMSLNLSDGTTLSKTPTNPFDDDRSIIAFDITAAETATLVSQVLIVTVTEGDSSTVALLKGGLSRTSLVGC